MDEIDRLTVGVGLNSEEFQAGIDRIMEGLDGLKSTTEEAAEGMGASFATMGESVAGLALKFGGLFLAVAGIEDVIGYFKDLSGELANLGWAGEYLGQSSAQLSKWGEVARLAGGHAEDAIAAVQGLQSAIFGLEYQGQMSQNLLMLNRLRVAYLDPQGHMLPIETIAMNAAKALQQQLPGKANEAMRVQWAAQIFGPGGIANAVGGGVEALRKFYGESSKDQKNITQRLIDSQRALQQQLIQNSYVIKNDAAKALDQLTPEIKDLVKVIRDKLVPTIDDWITAIMPWITNPAHAFKEAATKGPLGITHPINDVFHFLQWFHDIEFNHLEITNPALKGMTVPPSVRAELPKNANIPLLKQWHLEEGGDAGDPTWQKAISAYHNISGGPLATAAAPNAEHAPVPRAALPNAAAVHRAIATPGALRPSVSHKTTDARVTINNLNVNAPNAKDANELMKTSRAAWESAANRSMERKLLAAQADPGMQ
ncbi:MAG: hypothetical protein M0038_04030 [Pseudomonadota bacterium]|nr:hypothetical protein [Pseudomonadota bacterium]